METKTDRPTPARTRRGPRWWWIVLVQLTGTYVAGWLALYAMFSLPDTGLFGVPNDDATQTLGLLAALGAILCLLSGPIFFAAVRTWRTRQRA